MDEAAVLERAVGGLTVVRRADRNRWAHLSLCVLDSVFVLGSRYPVVLRACAAYARFARLTPMTVAHRDAGTVVGTPAERSLEAFVGDVRTVGARRFADEVLGHPAVRRAEVALEHAEVLVDHGIRRLGDVSALLADPARLCRVERDLRRVPGQGLGDGRLRHLWMLAGDDRHVRPDRVLLRWLARRLGRPVGPGEARRLLAALAGRTGFSPGELDRAIRAG